MMPNEVFTYLDDKVQKRGGISRLFIIGHSDGNGKKLGGASTFELGAPTVFITAQILRDPSARRTWQDAKAGKVPPIAWFSRNAEVRFLGATQMYWHKVLHRNICWTMHTLGGPTNICGLMAKGNYPFTVAMTQVKNTNCLVEE